MAVILLQRLRTAALVLLVLVLALALPESADAQRHAARSGKAKTSAAAKMKAAAKTGRTGGSAKSASRSKTTTSLFGAKGAKGTKAAWKSRRSFTAKDSGLKDHAVRHSQLSPAAYLQLGQKNVSQGRMLKGGGQHTDARYHIRKLSSGDFSMTITNKRGQILSIDTWKTPGTPLTRQAIERGLSSSGVTPPKGFWKRL